MTATLQTFRLGKVFLGLAFVVALCAAVPAKAEIIRGWEATNGERAILGLIAEAQFANYGGNDYRIWTSNPDVLAPILNPRPGTLTLDIELPVGGPVAGGNGYVLTLESYRIGNFKFEDSEFEEFFNSVMIVSDRGTWNLASTNVTTEGDAFSIFFGADVFTDYVQFVFTVPRLNGVLATGGIMATLSEASSEIPEPATLAILGLGLAGLGLTRRRKK